MRTHKTLNIDELKPYENNSRTHSKAQIEKIAKSLKEFGWMSPVVVDENYTIIAGHGRVLGAKEAGITEVPCLIVDDLTTEQKKAYVIADNKLSDESGWDLEKLQQEVDSLKADGFDISLTGFNEYSDFFADIDDLFVSVEEPERKEEKEEVCPYCGAKIVQC